jgi:arylsulfatase A-like enzyme
LAGEGVRFTRVYTPDAPCLPSRTAFYSGRFGIQTGVVGHGGTAAQPKIEGKLRGFRDAFESQGLARQLQHAGIHTAMISPFGQRHAAHHFYAGFNEIHNTGNGGMESAEVVMPVVDKWLTDNASRDNWYLHINFWDIHTPYRAPLEYGEPFKDEPLPAWLTPEVLERHKKAVGPHGALEIGMYHDQENPAFPRHPGKIDDMKSLRRMIDGYDTAIRYVDDQIRTILQKLKDAGVYEETVVIISADHGENLGELAIYGEHGTADHATCNIPLIIKWPGGARGKVEQGLHYNLDWAPTLMDLMQRHTPSLWDGRSFADSVRTGADTGRDDLVISQCAHVCQRSVRYGKWLYMRTYHDGFHLFPQEMLYDIENDPHEQHDLAKEHPEICREAAHRLMDWHDAQMRKMPQDKVDPLWTVIAEGGPAHALDDPDRSPLPKYLLHLEATGRAEGARLLREKYVSPPK